MSNNAQVQEVEIKAWRIARAGTTYDGVVQPGILDDPSDLFQVVVLHDSNPDLIVYISRRQIPQIKEFLLGLHTERIKPQKT